MNLGTAGYLWLVRGNTIELSEKSELRLDIDAAVVLFDNSGSSTGQTGADGSPSGRIETLDTVFSSNVRLPP